MLPEHPSDIETVGQVLTIAEPRFASCGHMTTIAGSRGTPPPRRSLCSLAEFRPWGAEAPRACSARLLNSPAVIHSSRRDRRVVSDTMLPVSRSTVTHEAPVTRRIRIPRKHVRSSIRGLRQPSGWFLVGEGGTLPLLPRVHLPLWGQAGVMTGILHRVVVCLSRPTSKSGQPNDRWMITYQRGL